MKKATLVLAAMLSASLAPSLLAQPKAKKITPAQAKQMDKDRKITLKDLAMAIRSKCPEDATHTMRVLMRHYYNDKSAKDVAKGITRVLYTRFSCPAPHTAALKNLAEIGQQGVAQLELAMKCKLRRASRQLRLRAVATLIAARRDSSWPVLITLGRDKCPHVAIAAIKGMTAYADLKVKQRARMVNKLAGLMRKPTKEEKEQDRDLPTTQIEIRKVLQTITGSKAYTVAEWKKFLPTWAKKGCPVAKKVLEGRQAHCHKKAGKAPNPGQIELR